MKKFQIILILTLGVFLIPGNAYACGKKIIKMEKSCCKKETTSKTGGKSCCDEKDNSKKECGGKCGHSNCTTTTIQFSLAAFNEIEFKSNCFDFSAEKKRYYHNETNLSSGFHSLWLIPKIG